jgi:hypothetical protein
MHQRGDRPDHISTAAESIEEQLIVLGVTNLLDNILDLLFHTGGSDAALQFAEEVLTVSDSCVIFDSLVYWLAQGIVARGRRDGAVESEDITRIRIVQPPIEVVFRAIDANDESLDDTKSCLFGHRQCSVKLDCQGYSDAVMLLHGFLNLGLEVESAILVIIVE